MAENTYTVYMHTNKINNKSYVGITSKPVKKRWGNGGYCYKTNKHFWNAICKYGWDNFEHDILFVDLSKEKVCNIEKILISLFMAQDPEMGYNHAAGGEINEGFHLSEELKIQQSNQKKGLYAGENNPMYGISPQERMDKETYDNWKQKIQDRMASEENKEKLRRANLGKKYSEEINLKKGRKGETHHNYGKHLSEETKKKIGQANRGKKYSDEVNSKKGHKGSDNPFYGKKHNKKRVICLDTNEVYISISDASRRTGLSCSQISNCCHHKPRCTTAGGLSLDVL